MKTSILALTAAGLLIAACAQAPVADSPASPPSDELRQCKADQYQSYVGRNRSELPAKPAGETWRASCSTCAVTMDFNAQRMNIVYDQATGVIQRINCG